MHPEEGRRDRAGDTDGPVSGMRWSVPGHDRTHASVPGVIPWLRGSLRESVRPVLPEPASVRRRVPAGQRRVRRAASRAALAASDPVGGAPSGPAVPDVRARPARGARQRCGDCRGQGQASVHLATASAVLGKDHCCGLHAGFARTPAQGARAILGSRCLGGLAAAPRDRAHLVATGVRRRAATGSRTGRRRGVGG